MDSNRLEAFSDGVIAIIITIMVLELKPPEEMTFSSLIPILPVFWSYLLSFIYVGIIWNNHHNLFQLTKIVNGKVLWANLHFLFWLSLIPVSTSWMGEHYLSSPPAATYGVNLLLISFAGQILRRAILSHKSIDSEVVTVLTSNRKTIITRILYILGIGLSFVHPISAVVLYLIAAVAWAIPNKQIALIKE